jgi:hypothetical protein
MPCKLGTIPVLWTGWQAVEKHQLTGAFYFGAQVYFADLLFGQNEQN